MKKLFQFGLFVTAPSLFINAAQLNLLDSPLKEAREFYEQSSGLIEQGDTALPADTLMFNALLEASAEAIERASTHNQTLAELTTQETTNLELRDLIQERGSTNLNKQYAPIIEQEEKTLQTALTRKKILEATALTLCKNNHETIQEGLKALHNEMDKFEKENRSNKQKTVLARTSCWLSVILTSVVPCIIVAIIENNLRYS